MRRQRSRVALAALLLGPRQWVEGNLLAAAQRSLLGVHVQVLASNGDDS
jgi:hypothetical protein